MKVIKIVHHSLCPALLCKRSVVVDLGANLGFFASEVASRFGCSLYAVEASPDTFSRIQEEARVQKFNFAICGTSGYAALSISTNPEATSLKRLVGCDYTHSIEVPALTLDGFLKSHNVSRVDLLKLDIEGAEIEVFDSCSDAFLRTIDQITVEFHEWLGVSSAAEVENVIHRLKNLGFFCFDLVRANHSDVLFINASRMSLVSYVWTLLQIWVPRLLAFLGRKSHLISHSRSNGN